MAHETFTGIDVLEREKFSLLRGRRVGLITNHTGLNRQGIATADLLAQASGVTLTILFGPEHGIRGAVDASVPDGTDVKTGLPVYSLYGQRTRPTAEQLAQVDVLVYDIQDVGARFYTYISTLGLCLEAAAEHAKAFVVLDRPNPIGGVAVEGAFPDPDKHSFTAHHAIPVRHGLTVGELAQLFKAEKRPSPDKEPGLALDLKVVPAEGWTREQFWDQTGLTWTNPSPNMRSLTQAFLYPGIGLLEFTNVSVGRGTDTPFEVVGAPWIEPRSLAATLNDHHLPGVRFVPIHFTPNASKHANAVCGGINIVIVNRDIFVPVLTGLTIAETLHRLYPEAWETANYIRLLANARVYAALLSGTSATRLAAVSRDDVQAFEARRKPHLLYAKR